MERGGRLMVKMNPPTVTRPFTFQEYNVAELERCGEEICNELRRSYEEIEGQAGYRTTVWTARVMGWFADTAPSDVTAYHKSRYGEFLCDQVHATWTTAEPWHLAVVKPCRLRLALESEWGTEGSPSQGTEKILYDAAKIAALRADVKV